MEDEEAEKTDEELEKEWPYLNRQQVRHTNVLLLTNLRQGTVGNKINLRISNILAKPFPGWVVQLEDLREAFEMFDKRKAGEHSFRHDNSLHSHAKAPMMETPATQELLHLRTFIKP